MRTYLGRGKGSQRRSSPDDGRLAELEALHETAVDLIEHLDLERLLAAIVERAAALVGTEHGYLHILEGDELVVHVGTGQFAPLVGLRSGVGEGLAGRVADTGKPIAIDDYQTWTGRHSEVARLGFRAVVGVPLTTRHDMLGVLGLAHAEHGRRFGEDEIGALGRFARLAALAIENARLYGTVQKELAERRHAEEDLLDTVARLRRSESALQRAHEETIRRLAHAAEFRDAETSRHTERMSRYCELLARRLGLGAERCDLIRLASPLHDVGKIAIPDEILLKPTALTPEERHVVETHAEVGHRLLSGSSSELLSLAATIAWTHHERYDGNGYPRGLIGEAIPLEGRIAAVADVFDALTTTRVYRPAMSIADALKLMRAERGLHFDPLVLDQFLDATDEVAAIAGGHRPAASRVARPADERPQPPQLVVPSAVDLREIEARALRRACRDAERTFGAASGPGAVEAALETLVNGVEGVLASVYAFEHGRLWLVAQRGYGEVRDGFALDQGVMARAVRTGELQFVRHVGDDPDFIQATGGIVSEAAVPFGARGGMAVGVLNVETVDALLPTDAGDVLRPLAELIASRMDDLRGAIAFDVATLARLCVHASSLRGVGAIAEFATRTVGRLLGLESAQIDLHRDESEHRLASFWRRPESPVHPFRPADLDRLGAVDESGQRLAYSIVDARAAGVGDEPPWVVRLPLRVSGVGFGTLVGRLRSPSELSHEELEAATLFAQHTAALIDVAQALRREQRAAVTDSLTGLLNRRGFEERLDDELDRARRTDGRLAVVLGDCDRLKIVNDRGGHAEGDAVLQLLASCLRTQKRATDVAARYGGDEFALLLPDADLETALAVADRLRATLASETVASHRPSASFGVAVFPADGRTAGDLLRAADAALHRAKQRGGDEVAA